jgi:hypothetical protein
MQIRMPDGHNLPVYSAIEGMDPVEQLMRQVEAQIEENGWDQPPTFLLVSRSVEEDWLGVKAISWLPDFVYENPGAGLLHLARSLNRTDHPVSAVIRAATPRLVGGKAFYGLCSFTEAWMIHTAIDPELPRPTLGPDYEWPGPGPMPRDHPDRIEIRGGVMVTVDGRVLMVQRERGKFPEFWELNEGEGPIETGGRVVDALRMLCTVFHDQVKSAG